MAKYPEQVSAVMKRRWVDGEWRLFRFATRIYLSAEDKLLGTVYMTNPGSYRMDRHPDWPQFHQGEGELEEICGFSRPDPTMQNIIAVIRDAFQEVNRAPEGYVAIYNISTLVEADGARIAGVHAKAESAVGAEGIHILKEAECHDLEAFERQCGPSQFVMLGFLRDVFPEQLEKIRAWSVKYADKLVFAADPDGHYIHPYRWRLFPKVRDQVRRRLLQILKQQAGEDYGDSGLRRGAR